MEDEAVDEAVEEETVDEPLTVLPTKFCTNCTAVSVVLSDQ